jgi:glutamine synthetase
VLATLREFTLLYAPNVNSYKRFAAGSFAPTRVGWGEDNRTCSLRVVGHGPSLRVENRVPGADVNPYLCFAALLAAGLRGIEDKLTLPAEFKGNAYESDVQRFPGSPREAIGNLERGTMARAAFGEDVIAHYLNYARTEQSLFDKVVTNYERERLFERG